MTDTIYTLKRAHQRSLEHFLSSNYFQLRIFFELMIIFITKSIINFKVSRDNESEMLKI